MREREGSRCVWPPEPPKSGGDWLAAKRERGQGAGVSPTEWDGRWLYHHPRVMAERAAVFALREKLLWKRTGRRASNWVSASNN